MALKGPVPLALVLCMAVTQGCAGITVPKNSPDWYRARANDPAARHVPKFSDIPAARPNLPTENDWRNFSGDLSQVLAHVRAMEAEFQDLPTESISEMTARIRNKMAQADLPVEDAPPLSPPRTEPPLQ